MFKLADDRRGFVCLETKDLKSLTKKLLRRIQQEQVFLLDYDYYINQFFEKKIEELTRFFHSN